MRHRGPLGLVLLGLFCGRVAVAQGNPSDKPKLGLAFEERAVVASGLTAKEKVVWFGVEHRIDATSPASSSAASTSPTSGRTAPPGSP